MTALLAPLAGLAADADTGLLRRSQALLEESVRLRRCPHASVDELLAFKQKCDELLLELESARARVLRDAAQCRLNGLRY